MKIGLRGGHSSKCIGAVGLLNEYNECQKIYKRVAELLKGAGHTVIDCNSNGSSANAELSEGTNKANSNKVDFFASIHMNAGGGTGCEVWAYNSSSSTAVNIGTRICKNISSQLGLANRGMKYSTGYHDLRATSCQSIIIETLFVDSSKDKTAYDVEKVARAIANGIDGNIPLTAVTEVKKMKGIVIYSSEPDKRAAEYLADYYNLPVISSSRNFDYSCVEQGGIYAVGGVKSAYTSYLKQENFIAGNDRFDTMTAVLKKIGKIK